MNEGFIVMSWFFEVISNFTAL